VNGKGSTTGLVVQGTLYRRAGTTRPPGLLFCRPYKKLVAAYISFEYIVSVARLNTLNPTL